MERSILVLRHLLNLSIKLGSRSLINTTGMCEPALTYSLKNTQHTCSVYISCKLRGIKRHLHMALGSKIIDLVGSHLAYYLKERHRITKVSIVKVKILMSLKMSYALTIIN